MVSLPYTCHGKNISCIVKKSTSYSTEAQIEIFITITQTNLHEPDRAKLHVVSQLKACMYTQYSKIIVLTRVFHITDNNR